MLDDHRLLGHSWIWVMSSRPLPINGHIRYLLYQAAECDKSRRSNLEFRQCSGRRRARAGPPFWSFFASAFLTKCGEGERKGRTREMVWAQIIIRSGRKPNRRERAPSPLPLWFPSLTCPLSERILTGHNGYRAVTLMGVQAMPNVKAAKQGKQE